MEKKEIITKLIDEKKAAILQVILNSNEEMYLKEIAEKSNVAITSTFRILQELVSLQILDKKEWKTSKVYYCQKNEHVDFLQELFSEEFDGINEFIKLTNNVENIENIILHGSKKKNKASLLILGTNINNEAIENICKEIKEKGFEVSFMTLTKEQYAQMAKMGLYSGEKKVLR